jgi:non-specific serine/threonine protein kinase
VAWFDRMQAEAGNVRAALEWCLAVPREAAAGLAVVSDLWLSWETRGHLSDGRWLGEALLDAVAEPTPVRARGLWVAGYLALVQGDAAAAGPLLRESLELGTSLGDAEAVAFAHQLLGRCALFAMDLDEADRLSADGLARHRAREAPGHVSLALVQLAVVASVRGELDRAAALYEQADELCAGIGERWNRSYVRWGLGIACWLLGDQERAARLERDSLRLKRDLDDRVGIPLCVAALAWIAMTGGDAGRAARLLGATGSLLAAIPADLPGPFRPYHEQCRTGAEAALGPGRFAAELAAGAALGFAGAAGHALGEAAAPDQPAPAPAGTLTPRELEVGRLVAEGLSDREIAARLVIAQRTAETHVQHILRKLGARSRAQIAAWVAREG